MVVTRQVVERGEHMQRTYIAGCGGVRGPSPLRRTSGQQLSYLTKKQTVNSATVSLECWWDQGPINVRKKIKDGA